MNMIRKQLVKYLFILFTIIFFSDSIFALSIHRDEHEIMFDPNHVRKKNHPEHDYYREYFDSDDELAKALIDFLYNHTIFSSLDVDDISPPQITKVPHEEIIDVAFAGQVLKGMDTSSIKIYGLYDYKTKRILLLEDIDLHKQVGEGILLHELVHFLQYETGLDKGIQCINKLEPMAYKVESNFLEKYDHGHTISEEVIKKTGQCR